MNILFLCVGNSARSQIAEGLANRMLPKTYNICSAGSQPAGQVNKFAVRTMAEVGIDISSYQSKHVDNLEKDFMINLDYVIKLCAEEVCPVLVSKAKILRWTNADPVNASYNDLESEIAFRKTRENIYNLLKKFLLEER